MTAEQPPRVAPCGPGNEESESASRFCSGRYAPALLAIVVAVVFAEVRNMGLLEWDDSVNIYRNTFYSPPTSESLLALWQQPYEGLYIPVTYTVWHGLAVISRLPEMGASGVPFDPLPFHVLNLLLHMFNATLVFSILMALIGRVWPACAGALLFGLHPVQVEPVAWATGLKDVLSGTWSLLAIRAYLFAFGPRAHECPRTEWIGALAATVFYVLALLSKPSAVAVLLVAPAMGALRGQALRPAGRLLLLWLVIAGAVGTVGLKAQAGMSGFDAPALWQRPFIACDAVAFYLGKVLWPAALAPDYGRSPAIVLSSHHYYGAGAACCLLVGGLLLCRRWNVWLWTGLLVFACCLLPVLGIVPFRFQRISTVADRYLYLAMLGPALAVAAVASGRIRVRMPSAALALLILLMAVKSAFQSLAWYGNHTLFAHTLHVNPASWVAHTNMGMVLVQENRVQAARDHLLKAVQLVPTGLADSARIHSNLGIVLDRLNETPSAFSHWRQAITIDPKYAEPYNNMGVSHFKTGRSLAAMASWGKAIQLNPDFAEAHNNLGFALAQAGRIEEAIPHFEKALKISPNYQLARANLESARNRTGQ